MKRLYEFKCQGCKTTFEELIEYTKVTICPNCNSNADKLISSPRIRLEGVSGSFPSAAAAWDKKHTFSRSSEDN